MPVVTKEKPDLTLPGESPASIDRHHNKPPVEEIVAMEFREGLLSERPDFLTRVDDMIAAAGRVSVTDDETLGKAGDLIRMYRAAGRHVDETHKAVKAPYLAGGRAVDAEKNALTAKLEDAHKAVSAQMNAFVAKREAEQRAERERVEAEQRAAAARAAAAEQERIAAEREAARAAAAATNQAERDAADERAAEAARLHEQAMREAALAPAVAKKVEPVRSDAGSSVSTREVWNSAVEDYAKAMRAVKTDPKVKEAIEAAVARLVRAGTREIPGVKIWATQQAIAR